MTLDKQRKNVIQEIIYTEKSYIKDLEWCLKNYEKPLESLKSTNFDVKKIFLNMRIILNTNNLLLVQLESALKSKNLKDNNIGKVFMKFVSCNFL